MAKAVSFKITLEETRSRHYQAFKCGVEVDMDLEERAKLRKLLVQLGNAQKQSTPKERSRRSQRTILSTPV